MGTIEVFDHTADYGLRVIASDLNDLFETAAGGLMDAIIVNRESIRPRSFDHVLLEAGSTLDLLAAWLGELIFLTETQHFVFASFDVQVAEDGLSLEADLSGEPIDRDRHILDHEVKAVTRHGLSLEEVENGWVAELILDI